MVVLWFFRCCVSRIDYFNNSIYAKGNAAYGIYLNEFSGMNDRTPHRSTFKYNNIYASSTSGGASYAYFLASTTAIPFYKFDYNNYYSTERIWYVYHY